MALFFSVFGTSSIVASDKSTEVTAIEPSSKTATFL